ncbi:MAG: crossover junction endodeoxyribonuclease RuvC [Candidatus Omnitrophica bacterium]|nr:crossover junction endodeoxyribonuclease RuvC [Candidatus Omnitrophota bacterium]
MRILGIDPGLNITGYGIIDIRGRSCNLVEAGIIRSSSKEPLGSRLNKIHTGIKSIIDEFHPQVMVVEELYSHYLHPRTAILMGHVRGAVYLAANQAGLSVEGYSATRVKKAVVGNGYAGKERVKRMMQNLLNLKEVPVYSDVTDALALALTHFYAISNDFTNKRKD